MASLSVVYNLCSLRKILNRNHYQFEWCVGLSFKLDGLEFLTILWIWMFASAALLQTPFSSCIGRIKHVLLFAISRERGRGYWRNAFRLQHLELPSGPVCAGRSPLLRKIVATDAKTGLRYPSCLALWGCWFVSLLPEGSSSGPLRQKGSMSTS